MKRAFLVTYIFLIFSANCIARGFIPKSIRITPIKKNITKLEHVPSGNYTIIEQGVGVFVSNFSPKKVLLSKRSRTKDFLRIESFIPFKEKIEYKFHKGKVDYFKNNRYISSFSYSEYNRFTYSQCPLYNNTNQFVQSFTDAGGNISEVVSTLSKELSTDRVNVEKSCKGPEKVKENIKEGIKKGSQCLLEHGDKSIHDALGLIGIFSLTKKLTIRCVDPKEETFVHKNAVPEKIEDVEKVHAMMLTDYDESPMVIVNNNYSLSPALAFHELMHQLGYKHFAQFPDITYAADICCFPKFKSKNKRQQDTACEILKSRGGFSKKTLKMHDSTLGVNSNNEVTGEYDGALTNTNLLRRFRDISHESFLNAINPIRINKVDNYIDIALSVLEKKDKTLKHYGYLDQLVMANFFENSISKKYTNNNSLKTKRRRDTERFKKIKQIKKRLEKYTNNKVEIDIVKDLGSLLASGFNFNLRTERSLENIVNRLSANVKIYCNTRYRSKFGKLSIFQREINFYSDHLSNKFKKVFEQIEKCQ